MNFTTTIIQWFRENGRTLPWRETKDPYAIWLSEVILQQTRIEQGRPYWERFMQRWPTVDSLAAATEDEVLREWQGLGYYSRARNLHKAAKQIAAIGHFPNTMEELRRLKGIGDYTAAAIGSIAFGLPAAVVDGNVYRVLSRWMGIDTPIDSTEGKKMFFEAAQELLDKSNPALYNQAIMDFGALQCTPSSPDCLSCPLADSCVALQQGKVEMLPVKKNKTKVTDRFFNYIYVRMGDYTFIGKRKGNDIWKNLYELPLIETDKELSEKDEELFEKLEGLFGKAEGISVRLVRKGVKHVLSHRIIHANFYEVVLPEEWEGLKGYQKVHVEDLYKFAVPNLVSRFFSLILEPNIIQKL
jgi:A/G-specific adenine glycosylase